MTYRLSHMGQVLATVDQSAGHDFDLAALAFETAVHDHLPWVRVEREDGTHVCNVVMPATDQETKENIT
jgi:hypothetical protein